MVMRAIRIIRIGRLNTTLNLTSSSTGNWSSEKLPVQYVTIRLVRILNIVGHVGGGPCVIIHVKNTIYINNTISTKSNGKKLKVLTKKTVNVGGYSFTSGLINLPSCFQPHNFHEKWGEIFDKGYRPKNTILRRHEFLMVL